MTRFCTLGLAVGLMAAVTALADDPKPAPLDPAKLLGDWTLAEGTKAGDKMDKPAGTMVVTKDKMTLKNDDMTFVFAYTMDAKAIPATIDMTILEPESFKDGKAKGLIKLADGKVTLCYHPMGGDRPKEFKSTKDDGNFLIVMKKKDEKKEDKK